MMTGAAKCLLRNQYEIRLSNLSWHTKTRGGVVRTMSEEECGAGEGGDISTGSGSGSGSGEGTWNRLALWNQAAIEGYVALLGSEKTHSERIGPKDLRRRKRTAIQVFCKKR